MAKRKAQIIINLQYVKTEHFKGKDNTIKKFANGKDMFEYYDRDEACDKTENREETKDAFNYYNYRVGSNGSFNKNGNLSKEEYFERYNVYKPQVMWRMVVSFDKEFAIENNFVDKEGMQKLIQNSMNKTLRSMGLNPDNIEWTGWYHTNTENPHCHITFYEKETTRARYTIPKKHFKKMKSTVVSTLKINTELYANRDVIKNELYAKLDEMGISKGSKKLFIASCNNSKKHFFKQYKEIKEFNDKLVALNDLLPKEHSMRINTQNIRPYHKEIFELVELLKNHKDIKPIFDELLEQLDKENILYENQYGKISDDRKEEIKTKKIKQIDDKIANMILGNIKSYRLDVEEKEFGTKKSKIASKDFKKYMYRDFKNRSRIMHYGASYQAIKDTIDLSIGMHALQSLEQEAENLTRLVKN